MMLYVFHVDVGRMMSFDMTVALSSVENLKATIERLHGIPASNIVLLVSGGELLTESTQVSYYSAGTDTNPIYMFLTGEVRAPNATTTTTTTATTTNTQQTDIDHDLRDQVERSMELPAVYDTVVARAQLALKMYEHARDEERLCERLVHDQHLQQQGWSAVVANMEDLTDEFRLRFRNFCTFFDGHLEKRGVYLELLRNFSADLNKLARIPVLPGLMPLAEADFHGFDEYLDNDDVFSRSSTQQDSVLVTTATAATVAGDTNKSLVSSETTSEQSTSTSPHKKAKMGEEHDEESAAVAASAKAQTSAENSSGSGSGSGGGGSGGAMRRNTLNLLQWITSKENHNALQIMSEECIQGLGTFNEEVYEKLKSEVQNIIRVADQGDVKEIKGLGDRLMKLEEFKYKVKGMVQDQKELSTAFQQNQNRAINLRDPSILPDLCASHRSQLQVMLQNHKKILEHRRCIAKAKDELGTNLHMRLGRIVCIENAMSDYDNRLLFYHRCLKRAERHISIIEQIHQAPCIYVAAVTEVVRRKIFSAEFRTWASKLADDFDLIHSEEIKRRETFNASFEGHFLNILFPGMNDMPPLFANENPLSFDGRLPNLSKADIEMISAYLPDLAAQVKLPDMQPVIRFFVSRSGEHQRARWEQLLKDEEAMDTTNVVAVPAGAMEKPQNQRLVELQKAGGVGGGGSCGDESETDTEIEFEKVQPESAANETQSKLTTFDRSTITDQETTTTTNAETLTDENESVLREELQRLREALKMLSQHSMACLKLARENCTQVRTDAQTYREDLQNDLEKMQATCQLLQRQNEASINEAVSAANALKNLEINEMHTQLNERVQEIAQLKQELQKMAEMQIKCFEMEEKLAEMRDKLEKDKETAVALAREELIHEHKTEIESLRCRFKLMTSMERSPSDMSLEKIERPSSRIALAAITTTATICTQCDENDFGSVIRAAEIEEKLKAQFEAEKERAIAAAIEAERLQWQSRLMLNSESVIANMGMLKVIEDKDRQLEQLREREFMLTKENFTLKTRLDALTNEDANSWLKEKIEYLNRDKERLEKELEKTKRIEMESSFAAAAATLRGPTSEHALLPRSKSSSSSHKFAVLQSLDKGDVVFAVWSTMYGQFIVVQDSQSLFFVHGESLANLQLRLPTSKRSESELSNADEMTIPLPYYAIGIVVEKEYCQARKDKNRYRVPCGSKFYRVKLAPITIAQPIARAPRDRLESLSKSVSRSQSQCESQSEASSAANAVVAAAVAGLEASVCQAVDIAASTATLTSPAPDTVDAANISGLGSDAAASAIAVAAASNKNEDEITLLPMRYRYASVCEEDELAAVTNASAHATTTTYTNTTAPQIQSVITEQPTASNKLKLDLRLTTLHATNDDDDDDNGAATDTNQSVNQATTTKTHSTATGEEIHSPPQQPGIPIVLAPPQSCAVVTNDDSDEYRSLEGKEDEAEFGAFD